MADVPAPAPVERPWARSRPQVPFGTPEEIAYEQRAAETAVYIGGKVATAIYGFAFASLAFAYFYLRSSNSQDLWRPGHITAPTTAGAWIMGFSVAGAVAFWYGVAKFRRNQLGDWQVAGWAAVAMVLCAVGVQSWEFASVPFSPGSSGYSSLWVAWAGMNIFLLLSVAYWSETLLARTARLQRELRDQGGDDGLPGVFRVNVGAASGFWVFAVIVFVLFWVFFYLL